MTETEMLVLLRERYPDPQYAFLPHVAEATGGYSTRTADAIVMSVWPSRGLELLGIEVKCSRADWIRELRNPAKAEGIAKYVDRWWLAVADKKIVHMGELPPTWGLMAVVGSRLVAQVEAPKLAPQPLNRSFLAAVLRNAGRNLVPKDGIRDLLRAEYDRGFKEGKQAAERDAKWQRGGEDELRRAVAEFEAASGISIRAGDAGYRAKQLGAAVAWLTQYGGGPVIASSVRQAHEMVTRLTEMIEAAEALPDFHAWSRSE